jgi:exonuclease III
MLENVRDIPIIMGGDLNCTFSTNPIASNIDCYSMARPPNPIHSEKLNEICNDFNLIEPFRFLNPDLRDFSYIPRNVESLNKSRIDFFVISEQLLDAVSNCKIHTGIQNKLFDHKAVSICFNETKNSTGISRPTISNRDLNDDLLDFVVKTTVTETYVINSPVNVIDGVNKNFYP